MAVQDFQRARYGIGYMPEDRKLVPALTAEENILLPVWSMGIADPEHRLEWIYGLILEAKELPGTALDEPFRRTAEDGRPVACPDGR